MIRLELWTSNCSVCTTATSIICCCIKIQNGSSFWYQLTRLSWNIGRCFRVIVATCNKMCSCVATIGSPLSLGIAAPAVMVLVGQQEGHQPVQTLPHQPDLECSKKWACKAKSRKWNVRHSHTDEAAELPLRDFGGLWSSVSMVMLSHSGLVHIWLSLSILTPISPGELTVSRFYWSKGWWRWW